jgi:hypothetical protein
MEVLCCLSILGEISPQEQHDLDGHISVCENCRKLRQEMEQTAFFDLSVAAAARAANTASGEAALDQPQLLLSRILDQAKQHKEERQQTSGISQPPAFAAKLMPAQLRAHTRWPVLRWTWSYAVAAAACFALGVFGAVAIPWLHARHSTQLSANVQNKPPQAPADPRISELQSNLAQQTAELQQWKEKARVAATQAADLEVQLSRLQKRQADSADEQDKLKDEYDRVQKQQSDLEQQLADANQQISTLNSTLQGTRASLAEEHQEKLSLRSQLDDASGPPREDNGHGIVPDQTADAAPSQPSSAITEADARELFGARDLHIVDVYDVDRTGQTKRTYGRVYYVDRRMLLFYAFDLGNKRKNRVLASFQAWGYREPNSSKVENLGLFQVDDASLNRWVLRVANPEILTTIDTVFVTLEPPHGSPYPRGQRLLFASLAGPANHP